MLEFLDAGTIRPRAKRGALPPEGPPINRVYRVRAR